MKHFSYNQDDIKFSIDATLQYKDILIQCIISDKNKYSSVFNLEKLKNIDKLFGGFPPLPLNEIYDILCKYFEDNKVTIQAFNSKVIIEIEKDFKPNMIFEIERDKINSINDNKKNINPNNMKNHNNSNNSNNITNIMINKENNTNNNKIILNGNMYNDNMNNYGIKNNNINNIGNKNNNNSSQISSQYMNNNNDNLIGNIINGNFTGQENTKNFGGLNNNNIDNCNFSIIIFCITLLIISLIIKIIIKIII